MCIFLRKYFFIFRMQSPSFLFDPNCNLQEETEGEHFSVRQLTTAISPKFFKELYAQQHFRYRRQIRKQQKSITHQLKEIFARQISSLTHHLSKKGSVQEKILSLPPKQQNIECGPFGKHFKEKKFVKQVYFTKEGNKIYGEWRNGQLHGEVEIHYKSGAYFSGKYQHGIKVSGFIDFNNGYTYRGQFLGDKIKGYGELKLPSGKIISGEWQEQSLSGMVQIRYPTGQIYYGQVKNFKKHGKGHLFFNDGRKYVGQFKQGKIFGQGEYFDGDILLGKGYWADGELLYKDTVQLVMMTVLKKQNVFTGTEKQKKKGVLKKTQLKVSNTTQVSKITEKQKNVLFHSKEDQEDASQRLSTTKQREKLPDPKNALFKLFR